MGIRCLYFSKQGVELADIIAYIKNKFPDVLLDIDAKKVFPRDKERTILGYIRFKDSNEPRAIFVWIPGFTEITKNTNIPVDTIATESITLSASVMDCYVELFTDIAQEFGGYVCKNDGADEYNPDYWAYIEPSKERSFSSDPIEGKIFNLYAKYYKEKENRYGPRIRNSINLDYIVDFIKSNLDEIKKL